MRLSLFALFLAASLSAAPSGWQLGVQAYTFRKFTVAETIEKSAALDLRVIELYPGQKLGGGLAGTSNYTMDAAARAGLRALLRQHRMTIAAYGVCTPGKPEEWRQLFEFAREMRIPVIVSEPQPEQLDLVEQLADEFRIRVALHNHANPSRYWEPAAVLEAVQNRSPRLGACVDVGHWLRSGLDPVAALRQLEGRIVSLHLKDMSAKGKDGHCVPFGTGELDVAGVLAELKRQRFAGLFSIEHEHDVDQPFPAVRQSVHWFRQAAAMSESNLRAGLAPRGAFSADVNQVWAVREPGYTAIWPDLGNDDTSGYTNLAAKDKGTVKASGDGFPKEHFTNAFDGNSATKWCIKTPEVWIEYHFPDSARPAVAAYSITTANDAPDRDPGQWQLLGSNDGGRTWEPVDSRQNPKWQSRFHKRLFKLDQPAQYNAYRLEIKNSGNPDTTQLAEIELLAEKPEQK